MQSYLPRPRTPPTHQTPLYHRSWRLCWGPPLRWYVDRRQHVKLAIHTDEYPLTLGIGLSAQPVSGCDIGGFCAACQGQIVDSEMLTRWTIMGAFLPWFRNHYDNYEKPYQEPYRYPEPVPTICRKYIELRYRLIQYIYDAMYENTQTGKPICRPLFMDETKPGEFNNDPYANDDHLWGYNGYTANRLDDQFFLGKDILVAPIVNPGTPSVLIEWNFTAQRMCKLNS